LKTGWQIAGYSQAFDNRSTFILFRQPDEIYLVQCRVGYDVTRTPSTYSICYKLQWEMRVRALRRRVDVAHSATLLAFRTVSLRRPTWMNCRRSSSFSAGAQAQTARPPALHAPPEWMVVDVAEVPKADIITRSRTNAC
jgi:hypothetical protein